MNNEETTDTGLHREIKRRWPESAWLVPFLRYLTPALVGAALATIIGWLVYVFNSPQKDIARMQKTLEQVLILSNKTDKSQGEMNIQIQELTKKVDHQEERWERIDCIAELPPHTRRKC